MYEKNDIWVTGIGITCSAGSSFAEVTKSILDHRFIIADHNGRDSDVNHYQLFKNAAVTAGNIFRRPRNSTRFSNASPRHALAFPRCDTGNRRGRFNRVGHVVWPILGSPAGTGNVGYFCWLDFAKWDIRIFDHGRTSNSHGNERIIME